MRDERWKHVDYRGFAPWLFDRVDDPEERHDFAADPKSDGLT